MKIHKYFTSIIGISFVTLSLFAVVNPIAAATVTEDSVYDNFSTLSLKPDADAYWWVLNWGDDLVNEGYYGDASSVTQVTEGSTSYIDLKLTPDATPGYYTNAEVAELHTGYAYGEEAKWLPEYGSPVVVEARVRWVGDFNQDGSGDAVGTSGIWLWNSPADLTNGVFNPLTSMGFSWNNDDALYAKGLAGTVVRSSIPVSIKKPSFSVNMDGWVDLKMVWSEHWLGYQTVCFYVNGKYVGTDVLLIPITNPLSVEIWSDNQTYKLTGTTYENPTEDQSFQVDYVRVSQQ